MVYVFCKSARKKDGQLFCAAPAGPLRQQVAGAFPDGKRLRRGAVMPWVLLSATVIFGVVALGLDGGRLMDERRHAQATADAAALAAANDLYQNWWTNH